MIEIKALTSAEADAALENEVRTWADRVESYIPRIRWKRDVSALTAWHVRGELIILDTGMHPILRVYAEREGRAPFIVADVLNPNWQNGQWKRTVREMLGRMAAILAEEGP